MNSNAPTVSSPSDSSEHEKSEQEQLMEQFKTYFDTIEHSAEERLHINELFMTINNFLATILSAIAGYEFLSKNNSLVLLLFLLSIMGYAFSRVWSLYLTNYTTVNKAKWNVVYDMEEKFKFSYQPFQEEWSGKGDLESKEANPPNYLSWLWAPAGGYYSTPKVEGALPRLFGGMYILLALITIPLSIREYEWLQAGINRIVQFLKNIRDFGLGWVVVVILIIIVFLVIALKSPKKRKDSKGKSAKDSSDS